MISHLFVFAAAQYSPLEILLIEYLFDLVLQGAFFIVLMISTPASSKTLLLNLPHI
jgi:hypothetical protein